MYKEYEELYLEILKEENRVNELRYVEKYGIDRLPIYIHTTDREKVFEELLKSGKPAKKYSEFNHNLIL